MLKKVFCFIGLSVFSVLVIAQSTFSVQETAINILMDDPAARKVLEKYLPETISNPQFSMAGGMTLAFVAGFDQTGELTAENLEKIEQELAALAK